MAVEQWFRARPSTRPPGYSGRHLRRAEDPPKKGERKRLQTKKAETESLW